MLIVSDNIFIYNNSNRASQEARRKIRRMAKRCEKLIKSDPTLLRV